MGWTTDLQNATFWGRLKLVEDEDIHQERDDARKEARNNSVQKKKHTKPKRDTRKTIEDRRRRQYDHQRKLVAEQAMWGLLPCTVDLIDIQPNGRKSKDKGFTVKVQPKRGAKEKTSESGNRKRPRTDNSLVDKR